MISKSMVYVIENDASGVGNDASGPENDASGVENDASGPEMTLQETRHFYLKMTLAE
jgi:hypothetical protein